MSPFSNLSFTKLPWKIIKSSSSHNHVVFQFLRRILMNPFLIELIYFIFLSLLGFVALKTSKPRTTTTTTTTTTSTNNTPPLGNIDLFFTSVSASTVSSMSTVEMEVFSNTQLIFLTILMFTGGEIFTSLLQLQLSIKRKFKKNNNNNNNNIYNNITKSDQIELGVLSHSSISDREDKYLTSDNQELSFASIELLSYVVLCYLLVIHVLGSVSIYIYITTIRSARNVLEKKRLHRLIFSIFTTVSTSANCGFVPTNENMVVFKKNSGLLLIMIPQILLGNTFYAPFLRFLIWVFEKLTKRKELTYLLKNERKVGYGHLFSGYKSKLLAGTVLGFVLVQFVSFCALEWNSEAMDGVSTYEKVVGTLFEVVNSRHAGESVFDLSLLTNAVLVIFVVMMYLSPYTSFLPIDEEDDESVSETNKSTGKQWKRILENLKCSKLTYLVIFIILICITERKKMKEDPLNFNLLSIIIEVISAYGNVGFSMGYSCGRQIKSMGNCKDVSYGFAGKWSDEGKFILIAVMFFGRLKKFSENGGKSWKVL